jgi:hypothetical protein
MIYLAELYLPSSASAAEMAALARTGAARAARSGAVVRFVQTVFVPEDECCYVLYEAGSAADVAAAASHAGLEFDRVSPAVAIS